MDILTKNASTILALLIEGKKKVLSGKEIFDLTHLSIKHINIAVNYLYGCGAIKTNLNNNFGDFAFDFIKEDTYGEAYYEHFNNDSQREILININSKSDNDMNISYNEKNIWDLIEKEYNINKRQFGKKINFVKDKYKRDIIFRDVSEAFYLAKIGFNKPAVILVGGVVEELLRLYLELHKIKSEKNTFEKYLESCINNRLFESAISKLSESIRHFRNYVHLEREKSISNTLSKSNAIGAVSTIFSLVNDFKSV